MPSTDLIKEAGRIMVVCNACRYCEGFCAVFPAMERRRTFSGQDLKYLANLCHNCRDCYYACQYAPPHEFALNVPKTFAELRLDTYQEFTKPGFFAGLFRRNGLSVGLITALAIAVVLLFTLMIQDPSVVFGTHIGEGAFYTVIPYKVMVFSMSVIVLYIAATLLIGLTCFWRETGGRSGGKIDLRAIRRAIWDVMILKYLDGGGCGCNYPAERFSMVRRWFHHMVFYGFMFCFASTSVAMIYDHFLHWIAPYPFLSWPVMLGTVGGVGLMIGTGGLLYLKSKMDPAPSTPKAFGMDLAFLVLLFLTSLTGLLLMILRGASAMGILLSVHLGIVAGLFITMPYGKFLHAVYRYAALIRNAAEQGHENQRAE